MAIYGNTISLAIPIPKWLAKDKHFFLHRYDTSKDKFIDFEELKYMMEKLGAPQTHLSLKSMIKEVDEDHDNKISFREVSGGCQRSWNFYIIKKVSRTWWRSLKIRYHS